MKITEEQIKFIIGKDLTTYGNNTNFLITFYETTCESRGIEPTWDNIKRIMREDYLPETVMRKRREFVESTDEQRVKELDMALKYSK